MKRTEIAGGKEPGGVEGGGAWGGREGASRGVGPDAGVGFREAASGVIRRTSRGV